MFNSRHSVPPASGGTVSTEYLRLIQVGTDTRGLSLAPLLSASGINPAVLQQRGARVLHESVERIWGEIAEQLGDPLFGLKLADEIPFGSADLLDYLVLSSANVQDALHKVIRYTPLLCDADRSAIVVSGELASMRMRTPGLLPYPRELAIGLFARRSRDMFGPEWAIKQVSFTHAPLGPPDRYDRLFKVPVFFGMPFDEVVFSRDLLSMPLAGADARLNAILTAQADAMLAVLRPPEASVSFVESVQQAIHDGMTQGDFSLTRIAERLSLSVRTLQRRLRAEGISHRQMVRRLRHNLAARALDESVSQGHIARSLGYSGVGAFHRAFKSWSGVTPGQIRGGEVTPRGPVASRRGRGKRGDA
ncbi:MAG TPA: AraC family transcriptional regulator ligand-binding domain-containing protein [Polyangia bacterium]|nr:AraC family transcriptional regulator ligand-binding domain-containing protein [Polyangia bacterium]